MADVAAQKAQWVAQGVMERVVCRRDDWDRRTVADDVELLLLSSVETQRQDAALMIEKV